MEHGALVKTSLQKDGNISACRAKYEPTTSSVQFLIQGLVNWASREFDAYLHSSDLSLSDTDLQDKFDTSALDEASQRTHAADVSNKEMTSVLLRGIQKILSLISAKVLSQTPFGIRKLAGLLLKDQSKAFKAGRVFLTTWQNVVSLERYGDGVKDLTRLTACVRNAQPYRFGGLLIELDNAIRPFYLFNEADFESGEEAISRVFPQSLAFARSIYSRGYLQTKICEDIFGHLKRMSENNRGVSGDISMANVIFSALSKMQTPSENKPEASQNPVDRPGQGTKDDKSVAADPLASKFQKGVFVQSTTNEKAKDHEVLDCSRPYDLDPDDFFDARRQVFVQNHEYFPSADEEPTISDMHICEDCPYSAVPRSFDKFVEKIYAQHYFSVLNCCDDFVTPLKHQGDLTDWQNLQGSDSDSNKKNLQSELVRAFCKVHKKEEFFSFWNEANDFDSDVHRKGLDLSRLVFGKNPAYPSLKQENVFLSQSAIDQWGNARSRLQAKGVFDPLDCCPRGEIPDQFEILEYGKMIRKEFAALTLLGQSKLFKEGHILEVDLRKNSPKFGLDDNDECYSQDHGQEKNSQKLYYILFHVNQFSLYGLRLEKSVKHQIPDCEFVLEHLVPNEAIFKPLNIVAQHAIVHNLEPIPSNDGPLYALRNSGVKALHWIALKGISKDLAIQMAHILGKDPPRTDERMINSLIRILDVVPNSNFHHDLEREQLRVFVNPKAKQKTQNQAQPGSDCEDETLREGKNREDPNEWAWVDQDRIQTVLYEWEQNDRRWYHTQMARAASSFSKQRENSEAATKDLGSYGRVNANVKYAYLYHVDKHSHFLAVVRDLRIPKDQKAVFKTKRFKWSHAVNKNSAKIAGEAWLENQKRKFGHTVTDQDHDESKSNLGETFGNSTKRTMKDSTQPRKKKKT